MSRVEELLDDLIITETLFQKTRNKKVQKALNNLRQLLIRTKHELELGDEPYEN